MKAVLLDPEARAEIANAGDWYEGRRAGLGTEFIDEVGVAMRALGQPGPDCRPAVGLPPELGVRRKRMRRFPYLIMFIEFETVVRVVAVAHARQRPGYWSERL
jgi:plasmid stabilization system protein ParE